MTSKDLDAVQAHYLRGIAGNILSRMEGICAWMDSLGWESQDPAYKAAQAALAALLEFQTEAFHATRHLRLNLCFRCGHNLHGTPDQCPECGVSLTHVPK
jgi:rubrerythrin